MRKRKLQITVDERAYNILKHLESESGASSLSEVIRMAVVLLDWARIQRDDGYTVGAFKDGRPAKEVMLSFLPRKGSDDA